MISQEKVNEILKIVGKEPRTIQELSKELVISWITTEKYIEELKKNTGLIDIKHIKVGYNTIKLVYSTNKISSTDIEENLFTKIKVANSKLEFNFMEVFQYIPKDRSNGYTLKNCEDLDPKLVFEYLEKSNFIYLFSGNLSFLKMKYKNEVFIDKLESKLKTGLKIKIIARIDIDTVKNINLLMPLLQRYPASIELRHQLQPLRGIVFDCGHAIFKESKEEKNYKLHELEKDITIMYDISDEAWINFFMSTFWYFYKTSINYEEKLEVINRVYKK
ncbi:MAG: hypothetical protein WCX82_02865 [archaeon]|jgi:hypothetical protein